MQSLYGARLGSLFGRSEPTGANATGAIRAELGSGEQTDTVMTGTGWLNGYPDNTQREGQDAAL